MKLSVDMSQVKKLAETLGSLRKKALPYAARNALNATAFEARKEWVDQLGKKLTLRNRYTEKGVLVEKAKGADLGGMQSKVGSLRDYMATQEFGGSETKKGKHGIPIPTSTAAGQGMRARPRAKVVRKKNYMSAMTVANRVGGIRQRRNAVAVQMAAKGSGVAYLDLGRRKGLFRVTGTKRGLKVKMLYDLSKARVVVKPHPTLEPALAVMQPRLPAIYVKALEAEIARTLARMR